MATTEVSLAGNRLIPAPYCSITKNYQRSANGEIIGSTFGIVLTGKLMAYKGSPKSDKTFWTLPDYPPNETATIDNRLTYLIRKQEALRELFNADGKTLIIQGADGGQPLTCNPRVIGPIEFSSGPWVEYIDYTINLEADRLYPSQEDIFTNLIIDAQESWSIDTQEEPEGVGLPRTYRLTHNVGATGKRFYDTTNTLLQEPWKNAREFVIPKLGFDSTFLISSGVRDLPDFYGGYNHVRSENIDEQGGSYSVSETWILTSGTAIEDFNIETTKSTENGTIQVGIQGNITGLEQRNPTNMSLITTKYTNALTKYAIASGLALTRAQTYSGYTLNILPLEEKIGKNPITGTINYSYTFDNRPSNLIVGALSEHISVNGNLQEEVVARIPILGRRAGPIKQPINTINELTRDLSIDVVFPRATFGSGINDIQSAFFGQKPSAVISGVINAIDPANNGFSQSYRIADKETWDPYNGRFSRNITWLYE